MLVLTAYIEVALTDRDAIRGPLATMIAATRTEDGCEEYGCYEDTEKPGRYVFVERWRDKAALDRHMATPHMAAWMAVAGPKFLAVSGFLHDVATTSPLRPK